MISKTSQYVWKLLNDDTANPSDSVIKDIAREFTIDENWLRTGEGQMKKSITRNQEILNFLNETIASDDDSIKKRIALALSKLNARDWETIEKIVDSLIENK
jgi:transcriptional regulator with XRE-family HTH domain